MKIIVLILLMPLHLFAQDFTGIWTGYLTVEDKREDTRLPYELVISAVENNLEGYSLTVFTIEGNEYTGIKSIKTRSKKDGLAIEDDKLIHHDYTMDSKKVRLFGKLSFDEASPSILRGTFYTRSVDRSSFHGTIYLEKKDDLAKTKLVTYLENMDLSSGLSFRKSKTNERVERAAVSGKQIKDSLPVNGSALQAEEKTALSKERGELVSLPVQKKPVTTTAQTAKVNQPAVPLEAAIGQEKRIATSNEQVKDSLLANGSAVQAEEKTALSKEHGELVSLPVQKKPVTTTAQPVNVDHNVVPPLEAAISQEKRIATSNEQVKDSLPVNGAVIQVEEKATLSKERGELVSLPAQKKPVTGSPQPVRVNKPVIKSFEAAAELASRKTEILRSIYFQSDSLVLSLYDNGEIDGDTVSVLVNGQIVIARRGLTTSAIRTTVSAPAGSVDSLQVIMYAENLGRIAPNTGLLVIEDGADKYQVRFEGDFKRNSAVIFRRKR